MRDIFRNYSKYINYTIFPLLIVLLIYAGIYGYFTYTNRKAESIYNSAIKLFSENLKKGLNDKKLDESLKMFKSIVKKYPLSRYSRLSMPFIGYLSFMKGNYEEAILYYDKFKKKIADSAKEYTCLSDISLASCYEGKKEYKKATRLLEDILKKDPDTPFKELILLSLERLYRLQNRKELAKKTIEEFIKEYPNSPFLYMAKARLFSYNK